MKKNTRIYIVLCQCIKKHVCKRKESSIVQCSYSQTFIGSEIILKDDSYLKNWLKYTPMDILTPTHTIVPESQLTKKFSLLYHSNPQNECFKSATYLSKCRKCPQNSTKREKQAQNKRKRTDYFMSPASPKHQNTIHIFYPIFILVLAEILSLFKQTLFHSIFPEYSRKCTITYAIILYLYLI